MKTLMKKSTILFILSFIAISIVIIIGTTTSFAGETLTDVSVTLTLPEVGKKPILTGEVGDIDKYYISSISFYDNDAKKEVQKNETFEAGKTYTIYASLVPKSGYAISVNAKATINDNMAVLHQAISDAKGTKMFRTYYTVPSSQVGMITADKTNIDFGELQEYFDSSDTEATAQTVRFTNTSDKTVTLTKTSGNGMFGNYYYDSSKELKPGDYIDVELIVNSKHSDAGVAGDYITVYKFKATNVNDASDTYTVSIIATFRITKEDTCYFKIQPKSASIKSGENYSFNWKVSSVISSCTLEMYYGFGPSAMQVVETSPATIEYWSGAKNTTQKFRLKVIHHGKEYYSDDFTVEWSGEEPIVSGWKKNNTGWWYQNPDGSYPQNTWKYINGNWYYFNKSGYMQTGWQCINGVWYYLNTSGAMQTGWQSISGTWYYFNSIGAMQTQWQRINGVWYYLNLGGAMQTGWKIVNGVWYYFNTSGAMQTGWQKISGIWYYFNASGAMQIEWQKINGTWYYFDSNGAWVK